MVKEFAQTKNKLSLQDLFALAKIIVSRGEKIVIANDIDLTVSSGGPQGTDDPTLTTLHPASGKALHALEEQGHVVGFISNRSGWQIAGMAQKAGIHNAIIIGTYGLEEFNQNKNNLTRGTAVIDDRLGIYAKPISKILKDVRESLMAKLGSKQTPGKYVEVKIATPGGPIILERKGLCTEFPEGLAANYNFNLVDTHMRAKLVPLLYSAFKKATKAALEEYPTQTIALLHVWNMQHDKKPPVLQGRYSVRFEPIIKETKAYGMEHLLQTLRDTLHKNERIGLVLFAGDANADAQAIRAAAEIVAFHNRDVISHYPIHSLGIWVKPDHDEAEVRQQADIIVDGPEGYADLLMGLSHIAKANHSYSLKYNVISANP